MCNRAVAIIISDLNNCRVKNSWNESNIRSLVCYTNIDVNNTEQLLEIITLIDGCISHNYHISKDIEELCYRLFNIVESSKKYKDELEITMNTNIQYINSNLTEAENIYNNYNQEAQTDNLMFYIKDNYKMLISDITNLYDNNINALNSLAYTIDGINKIDHNNYE